MMRTLSIKTLIVSVMIVILAMVVAAAVFVVDRMTREALAMLSSAFLAGLVLAAVVYRRVAEMVAATGDFSRRIERGDFAARFATGAGGEIAMLAGALNRMVDRLRDAAESEATARKRLAFIVSASPAVIFAARAGGDYGTTYISPNIRRQMGYAPEDFIDNPGFWLDNIHPDDRDGVRVRLDNLLAEGHVEAEYRFRHRDGSWRWMRDEMTLVRDAAGEPLEMVGSWTDITAHRELETSLKRRDTILNAVAYGSTRFLRAGEMDSAAEWNLAVGAVLAHIGEATGVSRIWVAENSLTAEGDITMRMAYSWSLPEFRVADDDPLFAQPHSYQSDGMGVEALRLRRGDILQVPVADLPATVRAHFVRLGILSHVMAPIMAGNDWWGFMAFDDCTGERSWPEIERQNAELARANRMKSEFLATITHELKTPLNGILGFADLLDAGLAGELTPQQREYVGDILGAGRRLHGLVVRLLDLAQIDAGKKPLNPEETDLGTLLRETARTHEAAARARDIAMTVEETDVVARVDARLVRHLLDELIDNAIKFNRDGGTVTLRASAKGEEEELPSPLAGEGPGERGSVRGSVIIEVADSGIGIAAEDLPHLFEPFVQADGALERKYGGTGLGLALARRIAELHGGNIAADSTIGQGSRFTVRLPQGPL